MNKNASSPRARCASFVSARASAKRLPFLRPVLATPLKETFLAHYFGNDRRQEVFTDF